MDERLDGLEKIVLYGATLPFASRSEFTRKQLRYARATEEQGNSCIHSRDVE